ncbi:MAG: hypothetical protein Q9217_004510 [Psora testacea]
MPRRSRALAVDAHCKSIDRYAHLYEIQRINHSCEGMTLRECTGSRPELDVDILLHTLHSVNTVIENACLSNGQLFAKRDHGTLYMAGSRRERDRHVRHFFGQSRAQLSLFEPLEGAKMTLQDMHRLRLSLTGPTPRAQANAVSKARSLLYDNGRLDDNYINSFDAFIRKLAHPIAELNALLNLLTSLVDYGTGKACSIMQRKTSKALREASSDCLAADSMPDSAMELYHPTRNALLENQSHSSHFHGNRRPPLAQASHREPAIIDLTEGSPPPRDVLTPLVLAAAANAAAATPYWKIRLTDRGHASSDLTVHPDEVPIYSYARRLAHRTLQQAEKLVEICERSKSEAGVAGILWQARMQEVERREEEIEREMGGGGDGTEGGDIGVAKGIGPSGRRP